MPRLTGKLRWGGLVLLGSIGLTIVSSVWGQASDEAPAPARLGILLDNSPEMGFLVPQAKKEFRFLNEELEKQGREPLVFREMEGASIGREGSLSVPGRKNALYVLKELYEELGTDTVYWITSLRGLQSGRGLLEVEKMLSEEVEGRPLRKLIIRNIWQEQLQAAESWVRSPPDPNLDRLAPESLPGEWYRLVQEGRGIIIRSWQAPPAEYRGQFGFPWRVRHARYLLKAGFGGGVAEFPMQWAQELANRHQLQFIGPKEEWPFRITGRTWIYGSSLLPATDTVSQEREKTLLDQMSARNTIEEDLERVEGEKVGILFGFGYVKRDLDRFRENEGKRPRQGPDRYIADIIELVREARRHEETWKENTPEEERGNRVYATEMVGVPNTVRRLDGPDPLALRIGQLVRNEGVDAVYLFTNGYTGGGAYGSITIDQSLLARAIREASVRLYVRMPFETGPAPISLQRLALASGGGVFLGKLGDSDWEVKSPSPAWPTVEGDGKQ